MIKIENLVLRYGNQTVLDIKKLEMPKSGLYFISGPSGGGKSSFLNIISGLNHDYTGNVEVDGEKIKSIAKDKLHLYRRDNLSIAFQDDVLFDGLSVFDNIKVSLGFYELEKRNIDDKVTNICKELNILHLKSKKCGKLSGGERKRVSLARCLVNDRKIFILDEPTSSLDEKNKKKVFDLLYKNATNSLVIVVTHDVKYINKYNCKHIKIEFGKLEQESVVIKEKKKQLLDISIIDKKAKSFSTNYSFRLALTLFMSRFRRNVFSLLTFTFSLTAIALIFIISGTLSGQVRNAFSNNFNENTLVAKTKRDVATAYVEGLDKNSSSLLASRYGAELGTKYLTDMNNFFENYEVSIVDRNGIYVVDYYSVESFNHIVFLDEITKHVYKTKKDVELDEIILGITTKEFGFLQQKFGISISLDPKPLLEYLKQNNVFLNFRVENNEWSYSDEQTLKVVGFSIVGTNILIHQDHTFTEYLFENSMQLKSTYNYYMEQEYPWTLRKICYLYTKERDEIIRSSIYQTNYILQTADDESFSLITNLDENLLKNRLLIYKTPINYPRNAELLPEQDKSAILLVNNSYTAIESAMMVGFTNNVILGSNKAELIENVTFDEYRLEKDNYQIVNTNTLFNLSYLNSFKDGVTLKNIKSVSDINLGLEEIAISEELAISMFNSTNVVGNKLYLAGQTKAIKEDEYIKKTYEHTEFVIKMVINEEGKNIYHHGYFPLTLYKDNLRQNFISYFPTGVITKSLVFLNLANEFEQTYPYKNFVNNLNATMNNITYLIGFISANSFVVAIVIMFVTLFLLIDDFYLHFKTLNLLGVGKNGLLRIVSFIVLLYVGTALVVSVIQTIFFSYLISSSILKVKFDFLVLFSAFRYILLFSLIGFVIGLGLVIPRILKITPEFANKQYI